MLTLKRIGVAKRLLIFLLSTLLILSVCGCSAGSTGAGETAGSTTAAVPPQDPVFQVEITPLSLPDVDTEDIRFKMLNTDGTHFLYALSHVEFPTPELAGTGYEITDEIILYDAVAGTVVRSWVPETPGYYYAGVIGPDNTAVLAGTLDPAGRAPYGIAIYLFGEDQRVIPADVSGINNFRRLADGSIVVGFVDDQGKNGVCQVKDGAFNRVLVMDTDDGQVPDAGSITTWENSFSYEQVQNGQLTLTVADLSGIRVQHALEYQVEKLDSCCLTERGLMVCLSVNEGTTDAHRALVLYDENGKALELRRAADSAFYRMRFCRTAGVAVNSQFKLYLLGIGEDHIACVSLHTIDPQLDEYDGSVVSTYATGDGRIVLYFQEHHKAFLLDVSYE